MVCIQNEWKLRAHRLVCDHQRIPGTWKLKAFLASDKFRKNDLFYLIMKSFPWTTQTSSCFYSLGAPPLYRDETAVLCLYTRQPHENRQRAHPAVPCCQRPCGDQRRGTCSCLQNWFCTSAYHALQKQQRKHNLLNIEILPFSIKIKSQNQSLCLLVYTCK